MKRLFCILIASFLLLFAGCENVQYMESSAPEENPEDIYEQLTSQLPIDENVEQQTFTIVTDDATAFYQSESTAGAVSIALEERNTFLRDTYGAEIIVKQVDSATLTEELQVAVLSGLDYCDMISVSASETVKLYSAGLLEDMNTLPDFNVESDYFDEKIGKSLATNNSLYLLPDPTAMVYDEAYVLFYNRDLIKVYETTEESTDESSENTDENSESEEEQTETTLENLVMQGKWTWDKFDEISREAASYVYSHSSGDLDTDIFAFSAYETETVYPLAMWASCGHKLIDNTYRNPVGVSMESEEIITIADYLMDIYNVKGKYPLEGDDAALAFEDGRLAFFCNKMSYLYSLRNGSDKGSNFGFVPLPKYDENQSEYYTLVSNNARVISVPKTLATAGEERRKFVSTIISATCAAGSTTMREAYHNSRLADYINSNGEIVMLDTICDSITFDFATVYGSSINEIARPTINAIADYLDYGSKLHSSLRQGKTAFEEYCAENFT